MSNTHNLCNLLNIDFPLIVAPMFLVSNEEMVLAALELGATAAIPALNYRTIGELRDVVQRLKEKTDKPFGINLIVNASNFLYKAQLEVICEENVAFIITSLGSPEETINQAHKKNIKVFCDVTDLKFAQKVEALGADALIAVNSEAGGHAGNISYRNLIPELVENCKIPVISAGGIGNGQGIRQMMNLGAAGVSMGSIFIASEESPVSDEYKNACIEYGANDIVKTTKLSGTPCTVINTPYVQQIGTKQNFLERILNKNKKLKKWMKALTFLRGMKKLQTAAFGATYKTLWCAGPSIEYVKEIESMKTIIQRLKSEYENSK